MKWEGKNLEQGYVEGTALEGSEEVRELADYIAMAIGDLEQLDPPVDLTPRPAMVDALHACARKVDADIRLGVKGTRRG